jgi:uncharacterized protein (DUF433 family)
MAHVSQRARGPGNWPSNPFWGIIQGGAGLARGRLAEGHFRLALGNSRGYTWGMSTQPVAINHVELRMNRRGEPRAYVVGTRIRVQDVAHYSESMGWSPDKIVCEFPHLSLGQVHAALSYYFDHLDEIRGYLRSDLAFAREMQRQQAAKGGLKSDQGSKSASLSP